MLWGLGFLLTVLHAYPARLGMRLSKITEQEWKAMGAEEGRRLIGLFVEVNGNRLRRVDVWGWACIVGASVLSLRGEVDGR